mgnify:CR=1 FL=1
MSIIEELGKLTLAWARADLDDALKDNAKLRDRLSKANEEIGSLRWELDDLMRKRRSA